MEVKVPVRRVGVEMLFMKGRVTLRRRLSSRALGATPPNLT